MREKFGVILLVLSICGLVIVFIKPTIFFQNAFIIDSIIRTVLTVIILIVLMIIGLIFIIRKK